MAVVIVGIMVPPTPRPAIVNASTSTQYGVSARTVAAKAAYPVTARAIPAPTTRPGETRSTSLLATCSATPVAIACGMPSAPDMAADSPRTTWKYSGTRNIDPKYAAANSASVGTPDAIGRSRRMRSRTSGEGRVRARRTNAATSTTPAATGTSTSAAATVPCSPARDRP